MYSRLSVAAIAAFAATVSAQTFSVCNPVKVDPSTCKPNPAFAGTYDIDFKKGGSSLFTASTGTTVTYDETLGAEVAITAKGQAPTFTSTKYMFFGTVDVKLRVAKGSGIITTIVLESDTLDEIDWEWRGGVNGMVQANYFSKGDTSSYGQLETDIAIPGGDDVGTFHTYSLDWTPERLEWKIDGTVQRTLPYAGNEATYPQTPMMVKFGTWCAGCVDAPGTVEWAGGPPDWSQAPFIAYYESISITDNANGVANAKTYEYTDQTGSMASVKVNTGTGSDSITENSDSGDNIDGALSGTQGTATTLPTAKGTNSDAAAATATGVPSIGQGAGPSTGDNSTGATTGSITKGTSTATGSASSSTSTSGVVTAGAQKGAINVAFLAAAMFSLFCL